MNTRRDFIKKGSGAIGLAGIGAIPLADLLRAGGATSASGKKIVCVGGHPDDPESGCGGTTGEAGIDGVSHDEAARTRKQEAINACQVLNCKPVFAGQIDGDTVVGRFQGKGIGCKGCRGFCQNDR